MSWSLKLRHGINGLLCACAYVLRPLDSSPSLTTYKYHPGYEHQVLRKDCLWVLPVQWLQLFCALSVLRQMGQGISALSGAFFSKLSAVTVTDCCTFCSHVHVFPSITVLAVQDTAHSLTCSFTHKPTRITCTETRRLLTRIFATHVLPIATNANVDTGLISLNSAHTSYTE